MIQILFHPILIATEKGNFTNALHSNNSGTQNTMPTYKSMGVCSARCFIVRNKASHYNPVLCQYSLCKILSQALPLSSPQPPFINTSLQDVDAEDLGPDDIAKLFQFFVSL